MNLQLVDTKVTLLSPSTIELTHTSIVNTGIQYKTKKMTHQQITTAWFTGCDMSKKGNIDVLEIVNAEWQTMNLIGINKQY